MGRLLLFISKSTLYLGRTKGIMGRWNVFINKSTPLLGKSKCFLGISRAFLGISTEFISKTTPFLGKSKCFFGRSTVFSRKRTVLPVSSMSFFGRPTVFQEIVLIFLPIPLSVEIHTLFKVRNNGISMRLKGCPEKLTRAADKRPSSYIRFPIVHPM